MFGRRRRAADARRRAVELHSDARRRDDPGPDGRLDPMVERRRRGRAAALAAVTVAGFLAGCFIAAFGPSGYRDLRRSRRELTERQITLQRQIDAVRELRTQVRALEDDPAAVERIAREELGLVREGEITILLPRSEREPFPAPPPRP